METYFDAQSLPLFAVQFPYYRLPSAQWELLLTRLVQLGADSLAVSVPWGFHEVSRGQVDLTGATNARRNLRRLLELAAAFELPCLLRLGPQFDEGLLNQGRPLWLTAEPEPPSAALSPALESWYKTLSQSLTEQQWPAGPIIGLQFNPDRPDDAPAAYGSHLTEVRWPIWLRKQYKTIEALNQAYQATYRTVSEVPFPQSWSPEPTPLEKDARQFLAQLQGDTHARYHQLLTEAGWRLPFFGLKTEQASTQPKLQIQPLAALLDEPDLSLADGIFLLTQPIQIDPDPADVGAGLVWAEQAPIRSDGSGRRSFWRLRGRLWPHRFTLASQDSSLLTAEFENGGLVSSSQDTSLKIKLTAGRRPTFYQLHLSGQLQPAEALKLSRSQLRGPYLTEDEAGQIDLIFYLDDQAAPLPDFLAVYLRRLLVGQHQALARAGAVAIRLGESLTGDQASSPAEAAQSSPSVGAHTLAEARRGLSEANLALKKAMTAIGALEAGFETILTEPQAETAQAAAGVTFSPEILPGPARARLRKMGQSCLDVGARLASTAESMESRLGQTEFTVAHYQSSRQLAVAAAQADLPVLQDMIGQLRAEIAIEQLPLVVWRVHSQLQEIAAVLRWAVLRR